MYFKNIGLHLAYLSNKLKEKIIFEKKIFAKLLFKKKNKTLKSSI